MLTVVIGLSLPLIAGRRRGQRLLTVTNLAALAHPVNIRYTKYMEKRSRIVTADPATKRRPGRPNDYPEVIMIRAPEGTRKRLQAVVGDRERQADVIREALEREITRRMRRQ
jgi:hypothetical protein